jgi:hypothetical protein
MGGISRRVKGLRDLVPRGRVVRLGWRAATIGIAMLAVSLVLAVGAFATTTLYGQYGGPRADVNALAWADRAAIYSITTCRECHEAQAAVVTAASHADLICQTCHVPTLPHPGPVSGVVQALDTQTSALCATCHREAAGRPIRFPQVDPGAHYPGALCLQCHDPHTAAADSPPDVTHPLEKLPACTTCHAPEGLKRFPAGHQVAPDNVCLGCHRTTGRVR